MKPEAREGWMAEKSVEHKRYHYIVETMALCRKLGFYTGELMPANPSAPKGREDCAECYKRLRTRSAAPPEGA